MILEQLLTFFDKQPYVGILVYTDKIPWSALWKLVVTLLHTPRGVL